MKEPLLKISRTGVQRFETTFEIDLELRKRTQGQFVVIPSLCATKGADWRLSWDVGTNGMLSVGVVWAGSAVGAVVGWETFVIEVSCPAIGLKPFQALWSSSEGKLPSSGAMGNGVRLPGWQGKGYGVQQISVSFEINFGPAPTSIAPGYTGTQRMS